MPRKKPFLLPKNAYITHVQLVTKNKFAYFFYFTIKKVKLYIAKSL
jgi:hypothetical protein